MTRTKTALVLTVAATFLHASAAAVAQKPISNAQLTEPTGFEAYKAYLFQRAKLEGIREATIQTQLPSIQINTRAIALDRAQGPGSVISTRSPPLQPYLRRHLAPWLVWKGQERYFSLCPGLVQIQAIHGVDAPILLAIYGKETSYGRVTGSFDLLQVLASLAYEGRRRKMFEGEFIAALKLIDSGVPRSLLRGSYAGATGYPQFMPSAVLRLRADGDGDGEADIWGNERDALASIANYLREAGWKRGIPWGAEARLPADLNRRSIRANVADTNCPTASRRLSRWISVAEWRALGLRPVGRSLPEGELAALLEPEGPGETAYLLTANYRAILGYNCSNFHGMSVALLSDAIARR